MIMNIKRFLSLVLILAVALTLFTVPVNAEATNVTFVSSANSAQGMDYIIYTPDNVSASTPIFLFLHGDAEAGASIMKVAKHYKFMCAMIDGSWKPNFIFVMPINKRKGNWTNVTSSVNTILDEVTHFFGGSLDNMYIGGSSAGCDAVIHYQAGGRFKGAICMAGNVGDKRGSLTPDQVMSRWAGKKLRYYRDNLASEGGYGCDPVFLYSCAAYAAPYNVSFTITDTGWKHDYRLVDRVFLPENMTDKKGQNGYDAITHLIYG